MGSRLPELGCAGQRPELSCTEAAMAAPYSFIASLALVVLFLNIVNCGLVKRSPFGLADGEAEPIYAMHGFYGNPLYRPYGFGAWGYGSSNYMRGSSVVTGPNMYGGYSVLRG